MRRWLIGTLVACLAVTALAADTPKAFADRLGRVKGVSAVVNMRDDKSLGSISIGIAPAVMEDVGRAESLIGDIGRYAAEVGMRAVVVGTSGEQTARVLELLKQAGVTQTTSRTMADIATIRTTRVFLTPLAAAK